MSTNLEIESAQKIMEDYQRSGAVKKVEDIGSKFLIPRFVIEKVEDGGMKKRLIADCRELNLHHSTQKFRLDNLQSIFPFLRKGQFAAKIDLKDAYFHLGIQEEYRPYFRKKIGDQVWEYQAACFGLNILPKLFMDVMGTFEKLWRQRGMLVFVYLDDILILGATQKQVQKDLLFVVKTLLQGGLKINIKKSVLEPSQVVKHLGFQLNLAQGLLEISPQKLKVVRKELGKLLTKDTISFRKMAAILGTVRSFLVALPFLRAFTDTIVGFTTQH